MKKKTHTHTKISLQNSFPWLFRISYMWYGVIGWLVAFFFGWLASIVLTAVGFGGEHKIYTDDQRMYVDTNLFTPPIAKRLKEQNARRMESDVNVSLFSL